MLITNNLTPKYVAFPLILALMHVQIQLQVRFSFSEPATSTTAATTTTPTPATSPSVPTTDYLVTGTVKLSIIYPMIKVTAICS